MKKYRDAIFYIDPAHPFINLKTELGFYIADDHRIYQKLIIKCNSTPDAGMAQPSNETDGGRG